MVAALPPFHQEYLEKLVLAGADVNTRRTDGLTVLVSAASGLMKAAVDHWLAAGADVHLRSPGNCNALMLGAKNEHIVAVLLKAGADATLVDDDAKEGTDTADFATRLRTIRCFTNRGPNTSTPVSDSIYWEAWPKERREKGLLIC